MTRTNREVVQFFFLKSALNKEKKMQNPFGSVDLAGLKFNSLDYVLVATR